MKVLVLSDVHGNLPSLEHVLKSEKSFDLLISLGDVVNYGPWSNECVDLLDTLENKILLKGNHEDAFLSGTYLGDNIIAKNFFNHCYPKFKRKSLINKYLKKFSFFNTDFIHTIDNKYIYSDTNIEIKKNSFVGHSHRMFCSFYKNYRLINVGSVGQNRVNIDEINYVIWNTENDKVKLMTKSFSSKNLINEMTNQKFPEICIEYVLSKRK